MRALFIPLIIAGGCGVTDPGSGTGTLFTEAEVTGRPDSTTIEVRLKFRGNPVPNANVVITDLDSGSEVALEGKSGGLYTGTLARYAPQLGLKITSGDDELEAALEGPAPHVITRPANDSIVRRADFDTLLVQWEADARAERAEVEPEGLAPTVLEGDPFEAEIPLGPLRSREQSLGVTRENRVDLSGGAEGSFMRVRYKVDNRFTLEG